MYSFLMTFILVLFSSLKGFFEGWLILILIFIAQGLGSGDTPCMGVACTVT